MTREEAIEIIRNYDVNGCGYCHQGGDEIEEAFDMAIKALEQEPEWIPVTERLPEDGARVLISLKIKRTKKVVRSATYYDGDCFHSDTGDFWHTQEDVELLAWMPLPTPYKAESEDKE